MQIALAPAERVLARQQARAGKSRQSLEPILLKLKERDLVVSKKGKGGGYALARRPESITMGHVIRMMEGPLAPVQCASETAFRKCEECVDDRYCETRIVMRRVRNEIAGILDKTTLADACQQADEARQESAPHELMYYI